MKVSRKRWGLFHMRRSRRFATPSPKRGQEGSEDDPHHRDGIRAKNLGTLGREGAPGILIGRSRENLSLFSKRVGPLEA